MLSSRLLDRLPLSLVCMTYASMSGDFELLVQTTAVQAQSVPYVSDDVDDTCLSTLRCATAATSRLTLLSFQFLVSSCPS